MTAATSGGLGDIVYALPILKKLGVTRLYVKTAYFFLPYGNLHSAIKRLVESQDIECLPTDGEPGPGKYEKGLKIDYDLDQSRYEQNRGRNHIINSYQKTFKVDLGDNWNKPWLKVEGDGILILPPPYIIFQVTERWRDHSTVSWANVAHLVKEKHPTARRYFVGFKDEYLHFRRITGDTGAMWIQTKDIFEFALLVRDCFLFYGNQSVGVTLAQGLGKEYYLEVKPGRTNVMMRTPNEHIL